MAQRLVIEAGWVVPVDLSFQVIRNGAVLIEGDVVKEIGTAAELAGRGTEVLRFPRHVLLPGLVNGHTHVAGSVFRGLLEDRPNHFYGFALPMEAYVGPEDIYTLSMLGIAEQMLAGCTTINDMFHHSAETARAVYEAGIRAQIAHKVFDADLPLIGKGHHEYTLSEGDRRLEENVRLYEQWNGRDGGRIVIRFGAHAADTCSPELLERIRTEADQRGAGVHTHVAQSQREHDYVTATFGCGSVELLRRYGMLGPSTIAVHLLFADEVAIEALARTRTNVAHCPACVAKVAGRLGPFREIYDRGIEVGWGTDWATMDPWDAMRFGIVGLRLAYGDETLLSARDALWRFTMGSATILGWQDEVGSLRAGKKADLILVDVDQPHLSPLHDPIAVLVYNASGRDVTHVMIGGEFVVKDRRLCRIQMSRIVADAQAVAERVWNEGSSPEGLALPAARVTGTSEMSGVQGSASA
jgi:5-methylthioadenosine/S-adenosylhomocysteine deaminase